MSQNCFHCGETIPLGFHAQLQIKGQLAAFCCYGCQAVAQVILDDGLENFYSHRTALASKPLELADDEITQLRLYDDPLLQEEFVQTVSVDETQTSQQSSRQTSLSISGITCAACIWLLEREINRLDGVLSFSINHSTHKAFIEWEPSFQLSNALIQARKLGYQAKPYRHHEAKVAAIREKRMAIFRIAVAGIATMQNMMFSIPLYLGMYNDADTQLIGLFRWVSMFMAAPVVLFSALPFYLAAIRSLRAKKLSMDVPVSIAIIVAYLASSFTTITTVPTLESDVYFDSVAMFAFFLLVGRFVEMQTRHHFLTDDADMDQLLPETATILVNGKPQSVVSHRIASGDILRIKQGEVAAADGVVVSGSSLFDEAALTGEFLPVAKNEHDFVSAGTANIENTIEIRVSAPAKSSRLSSIVRLIGQAQSAKPRTQTMADNLASYFVALVLVSCTATGVYWFLNDSKHVLAITLSVLVVTCPCALSLATPTALTGATAALRKLGFLLAKNHVLEAMSRADDVIFDKTGTLTQGKLSIAHIEPLSGQSEEHVLGIATALERETHHPIARAFDCSVATSASNLQHHTGQGVSGEVEGTRYFLGSARFIEQVTKDGFSSVSGAKESHSQVFLSSDQHILARFDLSDTLRPEAAETVRALTKRGSTIHILSGDQQSAVENIAEKLGIAHINAEQSPEDKLAYVKALQDKGRSVVMVGDGINDLPVLAQADLSIAMGSASDLTKLNSDAVLLNEHLDVLAKAFEHASKTRKIIKENIAWALGYNLCMLPLAMIGLVPPYFAALGMSLSSLIVVFNSTRLRST
jgi:Cu2+-exporting ATPase